MCLSRDALKPADISICRESPGQPEVRALLAELDAYLASLYAPEHNHILDEAALLAADVIFLVARQAGQAVGCGAARVMPAETATGGQAYGEIKRMLVLPAWRGQHIGECILLQLEATLRAQGLLQAQLETGRDQTAAVRLYERLGYQACGAFGGYPDNGLSAFYRKTL